MPKQTFFNLPKEKQNRIIEAAADVFIQSHYQKVTIDNIVGEAGIPKGSFYQYFENKDDLYTYMFTQFGETKMNIFSDLLKEGQTLSFQEYMMRFILELKKIENASSKIAGLKQEFMNQCPQDIKKKMLKSELKKYYGEFEQTIELYIKKGEFRTDIHKTTAAYAVITCISNMEFYPFEEGEDPMPVLSQIIDLLFHMLKRDDR